MCCYSLMEHICWYTYLTETRKYLKIYRWAYFPVALVPWTFPTKFANLFWTELNTKHLNSEWLIRRCYCPNVLLVFHSSIRMLWSLLGITLSGEQAICSCRVVMSNPNQRIGKILWISNHKTIHFIDVLLISLVWSPLSCAGFVNLLGSSDVTWRQRSGSTLARAMACFLTALSNYLNQCWIITSNDKWHSSKGNFTRDTSTTSHWNYLKN